ncbi:MAG: hypothetical protein EOL88_06395 [Bacteroidia bacterium]|nr:hypothetical protein [Bacteroidia bacterium]
MQYNKIRYVRSRKYNIKLYIPLIKKDPVKKQWGFRVGDLIHTPYGEGMVISKIMSGKKVGVICKVAEGLKNIPEYPIVKRRFVVLKYKDLVRWNTNLLKRGELISIGTARSVNLISIDQRGNI